jgi:CBS domain-containing protein
MAAVVRDVMSTPVASVTRDASYKELAARLFELGVSGFPVVDDDGKVIGVVSEADMLAKEALEDGYHGLRGMAAAIMHRAEHRKAGAATAGELMTSPAVTVAADDTVEHAAARMYTRRLKRLPVIDAAGQLVGIITRSDVLAVFDRLDEEIRAEITRQVIPLLSEPSQYSVIVKDGVVIVEGTPESVSIGNEILARIRHVQGVVAVRDRLTYPVPPIAAAPGSYIAGQGDRHDQDD